MGRRRKRTRLYTMLTLRGKQAVNPVELALVCRGCSGAGLGSCLEDCLVSHLSEDEVVEEQLVAVTFCTEKDWRDRSSAVSPVACSRVLTAIAARLRRFGALAANELLESPSGHQPSSSKVQAGQSVAADEVVDGAARQAKLAGRFGD